MSQAVTYGAEAFTSESYLRAEGDRKIVLPEDWAQRIAARRRTKWRIVA